MTTTAVAVASLSGLTAGTVVLAQVAELPLDKILSTGGVGVALVMCWLFLKHLGEMRKEHNDTIRQVSTDFSATQRSTTDKFAETTTTILQDTRERENQLHNLIRETISNKNP